MRTFPLSLIATTQMQRIDDVVSFVGEDESGAFGILAGRHPFVTMLSWGLCRYRTLDGVWHYLALPGGMLWFRDGGLTIATSRYLCDDDVEQIGQRFSDEITHEEERRASITSMLRGVERQLVGHLLDVDAADRQTSR